MRRWKHRDDERAVATDEARRHLEEARRERERVDRLARELRERRLRNDFGALFGAAMRGAEGKP